MADTIPTIKRNFLTSQIRILSAPLRPTPDWRSEGPEPDEGDLSNDVVESVLQQVDRIVKNHNQKVYPAAVLSHAAHQIDSLYWASAEPSIHTGEIPEDAIEHGLDFCEDDAISRLPASWPSDSSASRVPAHKRKSTLETFDSATRYSRLQSRLTELSAQRSEAKEKLAQARKLRELVAPLEAPAEQVQRNLVTRDGELGKELERMKILVARLGGKLAQREGLGESMDVDSDGIQNGKGEEGKLRRILENRPTEAPAGQ